MESPVCTISPLVLTPRRPWITRNLGMFYDHPRARHRGIEVNESKVLETVTATTTSPFRTPYITTCRPFFHVRR